MDETKNKIDYEIVIQVIVSYLLGAMEFIGDYKNVFSVGLIPDGHHIYTGTLKAAGYRLLKPAKTLVLVGSGVVNDKVCLFNQTVGFFMGKYWEKDENIKSKLKNNDIVKLVDHYFDWMSEEEPFFRIISDYDKLVFLEVGDGVSRTKVTNLLFDISKDANLMFISDFHRYRPMELCKKLDENILDLNFVKKDNELFLVEIFLRLAKKMRKEPELLAYLNTGDISLDKKSTNGFGCILF